MSANLSAVLSANAENGWLNLSDRVLWLVLLSLLPLSVVQLAVALARQIRLNREGRLTERLLREDLNRLGTDLARQMDQLQGNLASRVAESNRDQREVNALFMGQMQQQNQGNGQVLENVRRTVTDQLSKVSGSLQDLQAVTAEVRSLKQVLGNVRTRGVVGELQLERLLSDILAPGQYARQVRIRPEKQEAVDFVISLPSAKDEDEAVLLPIDAKFPLDYYARLLAADDAADLESVEVFRRELTGRIRQEAKKIANLYIQPPRTTDFAILYLPTEGLFSEVVREADLIADIYRDYRIIIAGPSSMTATMAGLQAAFRLQALERRSIQIAQCLVEVQRDFHLYEESLERVHNRLERALGEIEESTRKASHVRRRLEGLDLDIISGIETVESEEPLHV